MGCEGNKCDTRKFGKNENNKIKIFLVVLDGIRPRARHTSWASAPFPLVTVVYIRVYCFFAAAITADNHSKMIF